MKRIILGGGCFWCIEAVFNRVKGVQNVLPGYAGGHTPNPDYRTVCGGSTGHAEVVTVVYDEQRLALNDILDIFFHVHDPTTPNRQGADVGTQYRSVIMYADKAEKKQIDAKIDALNAAGVYPAKIVTQVIPLSTFYPAEDYHHNYYSENAGQPYCQLVISPKLAKFRMSFSHLFT